MRLKEELRLLNLLSERLKRDHYLRGTEIVFSLSDSPISGDDQDEEKGLYHLVVPFRDLITKKELYKFDYCNLDYIYVKIEKRFRHGNPERPRLRGEG